MEDFEALLGAPMDLSAYDAQIRPHAGSGNGAGAASGTAHVPIKRERDEATGPTVCAANAGCVIDASWQPGHPVLGTDRMTGEAMYRWELLITPERWAALEAADAAELARCRPGSAENMVHQETAPAQVVSNCSDQGGWLYHKIKW